MVAFIKSNWSSLCCISLCYISKMFPRCPQDVPRVILKRKFTNLHSILNGLSESENWLRGTSSLQELLSELTRAPVGAINGCNA